MCACQPPRKVAPQGPHWPSGQCRWVVAGWLSKPKAALRSIRRAVESNQHALPTARSHVLITSRAHGAQTPLFALQASCRWRLRPVPAPLAAAFIAADVGRVPSPMPSPPHSPPPSGDRRPQRRRRPRRPIRHDTPSPCPWMACVPSTDPCTDREWPTGYANIARPRVRQLPRRHRRPRRVALIALAAAAAAAALRLGAQPSGLCELIGAFAVAPVVYLLGEASG